MSTAKRILDPPSSFVNNSQNDSNARSLVLSGSLVDILGSSDLGSSIGDTSLLLEKESLREGKRD